MKRLTTLLILFVLSATNVFAVSPPQSGKGMIQGTTSTLQNIQNIEAKDIKSLPTPLVSRNALDPKKVTIHYELQEKPTRSGALQRLMPSLKSVSPITAPADAVELGLSWLTDNQAEDGSWSSSDSTKYRDTQASIELLKWLDDTDNDNWSLALDWYRLAVPNNLEYEARKIFNMTLNDEYTDDLSSYFITEANPTTTSFGYNKNYQPDTLTTALAVKALTQSGYLGEDGTDTTVYKALYHLLVSQNSDGGFAYTPEGDSAIYPTEIVLDALLTYDGLTLALDGSSGPIEIKIGDVLEAGFDYLKYYQNSDGSFGTGAAETALAYDLLLRRSDYPTANDAALTYLLDAQAEDGSYNDSDPYTTALAVKALAKPDLEIGSISISTSAPLTAATVTVPITNRGYLSSKPFTLEVDLNGEAFTSTDIPYTMGRDATVNLMMEFASGFPVGNYDFTFRAVPSTEVGELSPDNNSKDFSVRFSSYTGPTPPEWIGAATSSSSGKIALTWLPSTDPNLSYYKIYLGTTPGTYTSSTSSISKTTTAVTITRTVDTTYYFNIIAFNSAGTRGDYSMETSAVSKTTPSQSAKMHGTIKSSGTGLGGSSLTLYAFGDSISISSSGTFSFNIYPGNYYFTAAKSGYSSDAKGVTLPTGVDTETNFDLTELDDGVAPSALTGLSITPGDGQASLTWSASTEPKFQSYKVYRSSFPITSLSSLTPLTTITSAGTTTYTDSTVHNGIGYYYAVTQTDTFGQESSPATAGPIIGNSAPHMSNLNATQSDDGTVKITYDLADNENTTANLSLDYWNGSIWISASTASGLGTQTIGTDKTILWNAATDFPGEDTPSALLRLTANDLQTVNNTSSLDSDAFALDTKAPSLTITTLDTSDTTPTLTGISDEPLTSLDVLIKGTHYTATLSGTTWSAQITEILPEAVYDVTLTASDLFANTGTQTTSSALTVDSSALITSNFFAGNGDGSISGVVNTVWNVIHNALTGDIASSTATTFTIKSGKDSAGKFQIERAFLPFNTAALPDTAEINSATVKFYVESKTDKDNDGDDFVTLVKTTQASTTALAKEDFDQAGAVTHPTEGTTRKDITTVTTGGFLTLTLNSTGLSWLSKTAFTKLGLREGHDAINSAFTGPVSQSNSLQIRSSNYTGTGSDPVLQVTYDMPITTHYDAAGSLL